jgi:hypothetical protein
MTAIIFDGGWHQTVVPNLKKQKSSSNILTFTLMSIFFLAVEKNFSIFLKRILLFS